MTLEEQQVIIGGFISGLSGNSKVLLNTKLLLKDAELSMLIQLTLLKNVTDAIVLIAKGIADSLNVKFVDIPLMQTSMVQGI